MPPRHTVSERPCVPAGEGGLGKEERAVSKSKGRRAHVRKGVDETRQGCLPRRFDALGRTACDVRGPRQAAWKRLFAP